MLGCLAYISFVFGKYVLSSSLLKSIPKSERIISTDNPVPTTVPASSQDGQNFSPQVEMRVLPNARSPRGTNTDNADGSTDDSSNADKADDDSKEPKKFDEDETPSPRHRRSRRSRKGENSDEKSNASPTAKINNSTSTKKSSTSSSAPIRRLNQVEKTEDKSPVPQPEKSTSTSSGSGDAASISPVPKPE